MPLEFEASIEAVDGLYRIISDPSETINDIVNVSNGLDILF
jgi:hypothetical protein